MSDKNKHIRNTFSGAGGSKRPPLTEEQLQAKIIELHKQTWNPHAFIRGRTADSEYCPAEILMELAFDPSSEVRFYVGRHRNTPVDTLVYLSNDPNRNVRWVVENNINTPKDISEKLKVQRDAEMSYNITQPPQTNI